jgi:hypothetical protein
MNEGSMLKPALIGGILLGVLSALPILSFFNCFCCAWVIGGGIVAARFYVKESTIPVTLGRGVALGLCTGAIGALVSALFSIPIYLLINASGSGFMEQMRQQIDRTPNLPPETREMLRAMLQQGEMTLFLFVFGFFLMLVIYSLFAMLGGTIGVAIFEKRKAGAVPLEPTSYQPPMDLPPPPDAS